ncbi:MAG: pyridoxal phosphate phosphatase [Proteobacteria bacterium]|nr:pyridoxal phosphate phosphatase [Pseudomonadota bacterium]
MTFRMIALDLDGTVLDPEGRIRPSTAAALRVARERGFEVVLVTGRHHSVTRPYYEELGLSGPAICCNGTYVYDFSAGRVVSGDPFAAADARRLVASCRQHGVDMLVYLDNAMLYEVPTPHLKKLGAWIDGLSTRPKPELRRVASVEAVLDEAPAVWKFVVTHADADRLAGWFGEAEAMPAYGVEYSWHDRIDVMPAGRSKGSRLLSWAAERGFVPADIVAFGDNFNDLGMLTGVGLGIAMGNSPDGVKAKVSEVIGGNDTDAIADRLKPLLA